MPQLRSVALQGFVSEIFQRSGVAADIADQVARSLVLANQSGHDSHGVIRVIEYVDWLQRGWIQPQGELQVLDERPCILVLDGGYQFGQVVGRQAMQLAISKARREGVCVLSLRRAAHLGRIGEFMEQAAEAGLICFSFTNTHGGGVLVAPHGGCERRLSANPLAAAAPVADGPDLIMDLSTSTIAEGKIKVARSRGEALPPGQIINSRGEPSTSPEEYYSDPPGALLPLGGHKGFALSLCCEILAGALTGAGCSKPNTPRIANGWMAFVLDPAAFAGEEFVAAEVSQLLRWVKSSRLQTGFDRIRTPGEPEAECRTQRQDQIEVDPAAWEKIVRIAAALRIAAPSG